MSDENIVLKTAEISPYLIQVCNEGNWLARVHTDGTVELPPGSDPNEAARVFWECVSQHATAALADAHAAGRRAGLEEAAGEAEQQCAPAREWGDRAGRPGDPCTALPRDRIAMCGTCRLATTLRARADGKGRP